MKIRFDSSKERNPTHDQGLKVQYAPSRRAAFRVRWYLILLLVASPLIWFLGKMIYGAWVIEAPAQLVVPMLEIRARDAAQVEHVVVVAGDVVKAGQPLLEMDNPEWRQRVGQLQSLTAMRPAGKPAGAGLRRVLVRQLTRATQKLALVQGLRETGAATTGEVLAAAAERDQREADLLAYHERQQALRAQSAVEHAGTMEKAEEVWLAGRLQGLRVKAPEDAVVSDVLVSERENVGSGTLLMTLQLTAAPKVMIYLDPADAAYARPGQGLKLKFPDGQWIPATVINAPSDVRQLPDALRMPFASAHNTLLVAAELDVPVPHGWLVNRLPLNARFVRELSRLVPHRR
ncbi:HlyD family efflux transporter periplasmic adaptor subunit [Burkholderia catarinensis]|uniref:HlyD family efflux transporter periplasmic adaptor subunit n=1 Tax=Burkholderia catarinensis TaxID=1108140 RepID=UPI00090F7878|nr:HlyD family secretion protein [Burkholderia catarinensis]KAG8148716.1 hypothetical protein BFF94_036230 [Burkholderia catarinensis]